MNIVWTRAHLFDTYNIEIKNTDGCGNPWNKLSEEALIVKNQGPKNDVVCQLKDVMIHRIRTYDSISKNLENLLKSDCWGAFTITNDRKTLIQLYFDDRSNIINKKDDIMTPLIQDIKNGYTVCIVMGGTSFVEFYFFDVDGKIIEIETNHCFRFPCNC